MANFSLGVKSLAIDSSRGAAAVPILTSSEAVTLREISISFSNASRALLNFNIDFWSSSYSSSWSILVEAYSATVSSTSISNSATICGFSLRFASSSISSNPSSVLISSAYNGVMPLVGVGWCHRFLRRYADFASAALKIDAFIVGILVPPDGIQRSNEEDPVRTR